MWRQKKNGVRGCPRRDTWRALARHATQVFCGQCHDECFFIRSLADVDCRVDPTTNDVDCEVSDVSFPGADVESALRGDVWFCQRRLRHKNVTWDIFLDGGIYFWVFLGWCIVFLDGLCDSRMFSVTSCWALRILGMCCGQKQCGFVEDDVVYKISPPCRGCEPQILKHITDIWLFGYWHKQI